MYLRIRSRRGRRIGEENKKEKGAREGKREEEKT